MHHRVSAIDIGSNAIRMMIADLDPNTHSLKVIKRFRAAVRLGHDVFTTGVISKETQDQVVETLSRYAETNAALKVQSCRAVATSAFRESKNGKAVIASVLKSSHIPIEVISGTEEGRLIHLAVSNELDLRGRKTMLIDIGGGSVEVTFSEGDKVLATKSFPLGTVRILENLKKRRLEETHLNIILGEFMTPLTEHIHQNSEHESLDFAIGTGGNLECLGKLKVQLLNQAHGHFLTLTELGLIIQKLQLYKIKDRIEKLGLRADRADVIVPAACVVQTIMRQAEVQKILIPKVGLRDGLAWSMGPQSHSS